jgi:hypothetical protein
MFEVHLSKITPIKSQGFFCFSFCSRSEDEAPFSLKLPGPLKLNRYNLIVGLEVASCETALFSLGA